MNIFDMFYILLGVIGVATGAIIVAVKSNKKGE